VSYDLFEWVNTASPQTFILLVALADHLCNELTHADKTDVVDDSIVETRRQVRLSGFYACKDKLQSTGRSSHFSLLKFLF
jgi:P2-related tail formation protein